MKHRYTPDEERKNIDFLIDIRKWLNSMELDSKSGINEARQRMQRIVQSINERVDEWERRES